MEDIGCLWNFQENIDELKQRLQYRTYELEITRKEANEEMRKNNEHVKKLLHLLQSAYKERDEAKSKLIKLQQQIIAFNNKPNFDQFIPNVPFSPDSPLFNNHHPTRANSSLTESNSLSIETHNHHHHHVSSPVVDSLSYPPAVSSPDCTNKGINGNSLVITATVTAPTKVVDQGSLIIENLAKGRPLPPKGRLLQAVIEAGPLLQTLLVAGSLPRWRNPPEMLTHQIPPVNIKGCCGGNISRVGVVGQKYVSGLGDSSVYYGHISSGSIGICSSPMLDFGSGSSGSCLMGERMMPSTVNFDSQIVKRQRIL